MSLPLATNAGIRERNDDLRDVVAINGIGVLVWT